MNVLKSIISYLSLYVLSRETLDRQQSNPSIDVPDIKPNIFLVDGTHAPKKLKNSKTIIKGDQKIKCISAASIVAKVYRDLYMIKLANKFPQYKWHKNFGYGTWQHLGALKKFGVTDYHRKSYRPVHNILSK